MSGNTEWLWVVLAGVITALLVGLAKWIAGLEKRIINHMEDRLSKELMQAELSHRRINTLDRILSKLTDREFDSRAIVEGRQTIPGPNRAVKRLIYFGDHTNPQALKRLMDEMEKGERDDS